MQDLASLLKDHASSPLQPSSPVRRRQALAWAALVAGVLMCATAVIASDPGSAAPPLPFETVTARTGALTVTVTATGTLQPTTSVEVGSELSGIVAAVLVQENDTVTPGQVLARLDTAKLEDTVLRSRAAVTVAEAGVTEARATITEARATLSRLQQLFAATHGQTPSRSELDTAEATVLRAVSAEASARAQVVQAQASLKTDETNLKKAEIRAPMSGVILSRAVEPGTTLVTAMSTPVLFEMAEDLTRMDLEVNVDEADIAALSPGQPATFTVSAWPGRKFPATVRRVSLGASTTDNVVTYKTVLSVANDDLALRPGMTATATITTAAHSGALLVPNAALRFSPASGGPAAGEEPTAPSRGLIASLLPRPPDAARQKARKSPAPTPHDTEAMAVWVVADGQPTPVLVSTGLTDGRMTEITGGDLTAGMEVITGQKSDRKSPES